MGRCVGLGAYFDGKQLIAGTTGRHSRLVGRASWVEIRSFQVWWELLELARQVPLEVTWLACERLGVRGVAYELAAGQ